MPHQILLIEDNPDDKELVARYLDRVSDAKYYCLHASNGEEGLVKLRKQKFDCVLVDYSLPGQNGLEVLKRIHDIDKFQPVIMLTGQGNEIIAVQAMKEGAQNYLVKSSVTSDLLHRSIQSAMEHASMERRLNEQRKQIQKQAEELELINEELETFTYIASHDLRSPLVSLRGFSGELHRSVDIIAPMLENLFSHLPDIEREILRKEICQRIPKSLSYINTAAEKMDRMTSAILKLSRLGRMEQEVKPVPTREVVEQCVAALAHQIEKTHTKIEIGELPPIMGNPTSVEQVFGNLLDNALKYLDPKRPGLIRIYGRPDQTHDEFVVQDNGRGIARDDMHKVFEIFRRGGDVENIPGEGMGMPYVRSIVKRHGGNIWCESLYGEGTTFHFTLAHQEEKKEAA